MNNIETIRKETSTGNFKAVARALTRVENGLKGATELLQSLNFNQYVPVIGITGPPGAGKSTLVNALINQLGDKKIAVIAVDPTSPFNHGSLLGDRIRMAEQFNKPNVFIRSLATRGSLGGLSAKTIEMVDVLRASGFDYILVETVGVGQSEVEIAGLANLTIVVLVPESGDEIQIIKSGLMEIADVFVVNKADREGADLFANNLKKLLHHKIDGVPVLKTTAHKSGGIVALTALIQNDVEKQNERKPYLLAEKAWRLIQQKRMADIDKQQLHQNIVKAAAIPGFNLYRFIEKFQ